MGCEGENKILSHETVISSLGYWAVTKISGIFILHGEGGVVSDTTGLCCICGDAPPAAVMFIAKMEGYSGVSPIAQCGQKSSVPTGNSSG